MSDSVSHSILSVFTFKILFLTDFFLNFAYRKDHSILLDCGDGIGPQLHRFYGEETAEVVRRIRGVYVSHMHLDHHIGLPELLCMRKKYLPSEREPLYLLSPAGFLRSWLFFYSNHIDPIHNDMKFIDNEKLVM